PSAPPQAALVVDAARPAEPEAKEPPAPPAAPAAAASASNVPAVQKEPEAPGEEEGGDAEMGTLGLPARACGHGVFVDGRRVKADGEGPLHLRCGSHVVQIGSSGEHETIELPCGGQVQLQ